ncbi:MAG: UDP-N-acetylmuramoyl-L-alanyl-D-glutamate--2,6-diaminopimelate ligase [Akkermansia sp.]
MNSDTLFSVLPEATCSGNKPASIKLMTDDSRKIVANSCYIAVRGSQFDGHSAIDTAIADGAIAIVAESSPTELAQSQGIYWVQVPDTHQINGLLMSAWNGNPSEQMIMLGITGTNGKTTISYLANHILRQAWQRAGLIGTIITDNGQSRSKSHNTTPGAAELQETFATMLKNGCRAVAMEVSSHALSQGRCIGTNFNVGVFTNLTQDHLDYHGDMENYYQSKRELFYQMAAKGNRKAVAIINHDDEYGRRLIEELRPLMKVRSFGLNEGADMRAIPSICSLKGSQFELQYQGKSYLVRTPLIGNFNISNSLAAIAACTAAGITMRDAINSLAQAPQVPGRMELVSSVDNVQCFVDYAHTPDALQNVCSTMKSLCRNGRFITIFGCGGDRDSKKRPLMGAAAAEYSDLCIVTSDNPRSEEPEAIIRDILPGIPTSKQHVIVDRAEAIAAALQTAKPGDVVLIAGKGHEDYQILAEETIFFSDSAEVNKYYRAKNPDGFSVPATKPRGGRPAQDR